MWKYVLIPLAILIVLGIILYVYANLGRIILTSFENQAKNRISLTTELKRTKATHWLAILQQHKKNLEYLKKKLLENMFDEQTNRYFKIALNVVSAIHTFDYSNPSSKTAELMKKYIVQIDTARAADKITGEDEVLIQLQNYIFYIENQNTDDEQLYNAKREEELGTRFLRAFVA